MSRQQELDDQFDLVLKGPSTKPGEPKPQRTRPVRLSVDVGKETYRDLKTFAEDMGLPEQLGRAQIPTMEVIRALIDELSVNKRLREQVAKRLLRSLAK